ncbi:MAG: hypothetical protein GF353_27645 [Candidatus Lokiarchaeota archaeon]|nr:hypothetical protein [Candidatus Lokiarchaeota archaeon]
MKASKIDNIESYIDYIWDHPEEVNLFLDKFTINYTHFFRNTDVFEKIKEIIQKPEFSNRKYLRIWSCPCATGEEPYSISMLFHQLKSNKTNLPDYQIFASDIDPSAIKFAKKGIYGPNSLYETPKIYRYQYFEEKVNGRGTNFTLDDRIKEDVNFIKEDLIKSHQKNFKYDLILCRNFLIYINSEARQKVIKLLESHLKDNGLLILGKTENLNDLETNLLAFESDLHFYTKKGSTLLKDDRKDENQPYNLFKKPESNLIKPKKNFLEEIDSNEIKFTSRKEKVRRKKTKFTIRDEISEVSKKQIEIVNPNKILSNLTKKKLNKTKTQPIEIPMTFSQKKPKDLPKIRKKKINAYLKDSNIGNIEERFRKFQLLDKQIDHLETQLKKRLKQVKILEDQILYRERQIDRPEEDLKIRKIRLEELEREITNREREVQKKINNLEILERKVENRVIQLENAERSVENRVREKIMQLEELEQQIKLRGDEILNKEGLVKQKQKKIKDNQNLINRGVKKSTELETEVKERTKEILKKTPDSLKITELNIRNELVIKPNHYGLINLNSDKNKSKKLTLYGLGSGIALILKENVAKIYGISYCAPDETHNREKEKNKLKIVNKLFQEMMNQGANKRQMSAILVGGTKSFECDSDSLQKKELELKHWLRNTEITLEKEDLGGLSERTVVYDTYENKIYVKKGWENYFRIINGE